MSWPELLLKLMTDHTLYRRLLRLTFHVIAIVVPLACIILAFK